MSTRTLVSSLLVGLMALSFAGCQNNKASMCDPSTCDMKECRDAKKCMGNCEKKECDGKCDSKKTSMSGHHAETVTVAAVTPAAADAKCINTVCPIGGHKLDGEALKVNYKGKTIGLCCPDCVEEMNKMSEAKRDEVLAKASAK